MLLPSMCHAVLGLAVKKAAVAGCSSRIPHSDWWQVTAEPCAVHPTITRSPHTHTNTQTRIHTHPSIHRHRHTHTQRQAGIHTYTQHPISHAHAGIIYLCNQTQTPIFIHRHIDTDSHSHTTEDVPQGQHWPPLSWSHKHASVFCAVWTLLHLPFMLHIRCWSGCQSGSPL